MLLGKVTSVIETMEKATLDRADGIHARINEGGEKHWQRAKQLLASSLS
mgnify:CR=1 FL=1